MICGVGKKLNSDRQTLFFIFIYMTLVLIGGFCDDSGCNFVGDGASGYDSARFKS